MRFTKDAVQVPNHCVFFPQIGGHHEQGFIEADGLLTGLHDTPYVSAVAFQEIARKFPQLGVCPRSELTEAQAELAAIKAENEDLKEDLKQADQRINAIEVMESAGYRARKKPGRKPAKAA